MRFFFFLSFFALSFSSQAQDIYSIILEDEQVVISYQTLEVKKKGQMIPEIRFSIENKSNSGLNVDFVINFEYEMEIVEVTAVEDICIAAGKTKKGKIKGLFYQPEKLSLEQLRSEDFDILLDDLILVKVADCK
jgi:hypothetical protein